MRGAAFVTFLLKLPVNEKTGMRYIELHVNLTTSRFFHLKTHEVSGEALTDLNEIWTKYLFTKTHQIILK